MAHKIVVDGVSYMLSVATIHDDGSVTVEPFSAEIPGTSFYNGEIAIHTNPPDMPDVFHNNKPLLLIH